jgi:hypothetical protein
MITITFPDLGDRPHALTLAYAGEVDDRAAADAALDTALVQAFTELDAYVVYGSCQETDPLLDFWRRQIGRVVHTHPHVASCFADWRGTTLVWHWGKAETLLTRRTDWAPFAPRAVWDASLKASAASVAAIDTPKPGDLIVERIDGKAVGMTRA